MVSIDSTIARLHQTLFDCDRRKSPEHWLNDEVKNLIISDWKEYQKSHGLTLFIFGSKEVNSFIASLEAEKDLETVRTMVDYFPMRKVDTMTKIIEKNRKMVEAVA